MTHRDAKPPPTRWLWALALGWGTGLAALMAWSGLRSPAPVSKAIGQQSSDLAATRGTTP